MIFTFDCVTVQTEDFFLYSRSTNEPLTSFHVSFLSRQKDELDKLVCSQLQHVWVFIAQLVEHCCFHA